MPHFSPAPPAVVATYSWVLQRALIFARQNATALSVDELFDLMDSLHNVPEMLSRYGGWNIETNIDQDLKRYDERWGTRTTGSWKLSLLEELHLARKSYLEDMKKEP